MIEAGAEPILTVVVATYGRPDALRCALESLVLQSFERWRSIVVGDADPDAAEVVDAVGDERIRFVNLPSRQGEQSRPNSVGFRLVETPLVALLNHDDLLLQDHLSRALPSMDAGTELHTSSAAFTSTQLRLSDGSIRPVFSERTPHIRALSDAFSAGVPLFEPASTWVMTRELIERVGGWRPAAELHRTPAVDWLLRAWRAGAQFVHDPVVTVVKCNTHRRSGESREYAHTADELTTLLRLVRELGPDRFRALIDDDLGAAAERGLDPPRDPWRAFGTRHAAVRWQRRLDDDAARARFLETEEDVFEEIAVERGRHRGFTGRRALARRTGEDLGRPSDLDELVDACRRQLGSTGG